MKRLRALLEKRERKREKRSCLIAWPRREPCYTQHLFDNRRRRHGRGNTVLFHLIWLFEGPLETCGIIWNRVNQETKNHRNPLISYKQPYISNMNKNYTFNRRIKFSVRTGGIHRECNWKILPNFYTSNRFPPGFSIDYFLRGLRE